MATKIGDILRNKIEHASDAVGDALYEIADASWVVRENVGIKSAQSHLVEAERHLALAQKAVGPPPQDG